MKKEIIDQFRAVLEFCGYDYDEVLSNHSRKRVYVDLRSIIFHICNRERHLAPSQIGQIFGWNRCTVFCAIEKVYSLRKVDRVFNDMYDSIHGAYMALSAKKEGESNETKTM